MRKLIGILAAGLLGMATPVSAAPIQLSISGTLVGTQNTIVCPQAPSECWYSNPLGETSVSYSSAFMETLIPIELREGDNNFTYGDPDSGGLFSGVISNNNGILTGRDLLFFLQSGGIQSAEVGSTYIRASARTFSVAAIAAVPEPGTWAMMLLGFFTVGAALRQGPRWALLPA